MKRIFRIPKQFNTGKRYALIGVGNGSRKLVFDFKYIFEDKINIEKVIYWDENVDLKSELDGYICCTYDRVDAKRKLFNVKLKYKRDYFFAEDLFGFLNDWRGKRIAYKTYPDDLTKWLQAIVFEYAAEKGIVLPEDKNRELLTLWKHKRNTVHIIKRISHVYCLIPGAIKMVPQIAGCKNNYKKYDYICFIRTAEAIKFKKDFADSAHKVITLEELRIHSFAPLYMRATYFDKRQDDCACNAPFYNLWVGTNGTTRICECPDYLNIACGNVGATELSKIWKSPTTDIIRLSCLNNTYTFCSREECAKLSKDVTKSTFLEPRVEKITDYPTILNVANDNICNLHCPACRMNVYAKNNEDSQLEIDTCLDELFASGWLDKADILYVGGGGEIFLSKDYKRVLYESSSKRKNVVIMTNGTLFTPKEWEQLEGKYDQITFLVSIDAATKETYEKVRCGGNWNKLMENMYFLSELRKENKVDVVKVIMIVQKANYKEIPDFIKWGKEMGFDEVVLSHVRNWGTFMDDYFYENISMFDNTGRIKPELQEIMNNPICSEDIVYTSWRA